MNIELVSSQVARFVLVLDGKKDYVELPPASIPSGNEITCSFWAYGGDSLPANSTIISAFDEPGTRLLSIHVPWGDSLIYFDCGCENGSFNRIGKKIEPGDFKNKWSHWAFTKNSSIGEMKIYLNGELLHSETGKNFKIPKTAKAQLGFYSLGYYYYHGMLAELQLWNVAHTQPEIQQNMNRQMTGTEPNLVAYWPLNEGVGSIATDKTVNGNNGTIHGATWQQQELPIKHAQKKLEGGNTVDDKTYVDSENNFYLVDTNNPINGTGELTGWDIWAKSTLPVQLIIYRKVADSWSVIGQGDVKTPKVGVNQFTLSAPIKVEKGDFVGIYHPQKGAVSFSTSSASDLGNLSGTVLFTVSGAAPTALSRSGNRIYSVKVKGNLVQTPPTVIGGQQTIPPVTSQSKFVKVGTKGGAIPSQDFDFQPKDTTSRLTKVSIFFAWAISSFGVEYENPGNPVQTYRLGPVGCGGGQKAEVSIAPGDYLTKVTGTWGRQAPGYPKEEIITIQFETNKGVKSPIFGGGSGKQEVEAFALEAPQGHEIIGFFGAHGGPQDLIIRLGIYCQPVKLIQTPTLAKVETIEETYDQYVLNQCAKFLARSNTDPRHNFGQLTNDDPRSRIAESWRFPIIDSYSDSKDFVKSYSSNLVTFVYQQQGNTAPKDVTIVGTFANLFQPIPLKPVKFLGEETGYYALSVVVPKAQIHTYKFIVDGQAILDPINPQRAQLDNGKFWSRFFTQLCTEPLSFEDWESDILARLVDHILPFHTAEGENFLNRYYNDLGKQDKQVQYAYAYRLDQSVGAVNYIDNILAREENHHLIDYKICLGQISRILRQRNPYIDPQNVSKELYIDIYNEMANNQVNGWDYQQYQEPKYFLQLLRRHTYTGAFSHPKYGGNVGGTGWAYLAERYTDDKGQTLFNWRKSIEQPLGVNSDYRG